MMIGKNIKAMREKRGLHQVELAERAGVTQSYISRIEAGTKEPSISTIVKIAVALRCTAAELLADEDETA